MNRSAFLFLSLMGIALTISGCAGYQLGEVKPSALAGINKIHVPPFKNSTLEPRLSSLVTNAVLKEIQLDGTYTVSNKRDCDAILVGEVREVRKRQLRAVRNNTLESRELSLELYLEYRLVDPHTGDEIRSTATRPSSATKEVSSSSDEVYYARRARVIGKTIQFVDASFQVGERNALSLAAQDGAAKLVSQIADGW